jgi:acetyltransferase-like isoleucine patch superfamily enzyme
MRRFAKKAFFGVCFLLVSPLILAAWVEDKFFKGEEAFVSLGQLLALAPGIVGSFLRAAYYSGTLDRCSREVRIGFGSFFSHRAARIAGNVSLGAYCVLGTVEVGEGTMIASRVSIPSGKRQHFDDAGNLSSDIRLDRGAVGRGCWIGEGAILLSAIGDHCIVSAGAVVTNEMPGRCIVGGNPARVLRTITAPE